MTRLWLISSAALTLLAGAAQAQMGPGGGPRSDPDTDRDGKVTYAEFKAAAGNRMMDRLDANKDGKVSKAEYQTLVDRMTQFGGPEAAARAAERWAQDDTNKDGFLSRAEMDAAGKRRFDAADSNHDGWLSKGELLTMRQNRRGGAGG